jgi:tRNA G10  N-methylase Trm11
VKLKKEEAQKRRQIMTDHEDIQHVQWSSYLALVPRGFQDVVSSIIQEQLEEHENRIEYIGEDKQQSSDLLAQAASKLQAKAEKKEKKQTAKQGKEEHHDGIQLTHKLVGGTVMEQRHYNVGYNAEQQAVWTCPGQLAGSLWLRLETTAPYEKVAHLRCLGPLVALVCSSTTACQHLSPLHTLEEATKDIRGWIGSQGGDEYQKSLDRALEVWKGHVVQTCSWKNAMSEVDYKALEKRVRTNQLMYRLSSMRDSSLLSLSSSSTKYPYARHDLLAALLEEEKEENGNHHSLIVPSTLQDSWKVNLTSHDLELVVLQQDDKVAIGIALRPYPQVGSKSFATGNIPPDITPPYIGGDALSGLVRLRPTTAHLLLHMANIQPGDVILDPCAGIGTIPLEADEYYFSSSIPPPSRAIGLGGDLVLDHPQIVSAANGLASANSTQSSKSACCMAAWDAAYLPIRTASVDVIVSDLPFGQQCLSAKALSDLLPLIVSEMARVLRPRGRMVLLCGSHELVLQALTDTSSHWELPCTAMVPVTIGGLLAWVVQVERNTTVHVPLLHHLERIRVLTEKRERIARHRSKEQEAAAASSPLAKPQVKKRPKVQA